MLEITLGIVLFTSITILLVMVVLYARSKLVTRGSVFIEITNAPKRSFRTQSGDKLLESLKQQDIHLAAACGGGGVCGQCRVKVVKGGGQILPTEIGLINKRQAAEGERLSCQLTVKNDLEIELPTEVLSVKRWKCEVTSNKNVATFIKELVLQLPEGEELDFEPGSYVLIEAPAHELAFTDIDIDERFREEWDQYNLWNLRSRVGEPITRAYSMASYPGEEGGIKLNIRIVLPPVSAGGVPPGKMSSYLFALKPGDKLTISGPFGEFFPHSSDSEMIYVGGGSGMAPLRSHLFYMLKKDCSLRKISYWYGARNLRELFYNDEFEALQKQCHNFTWNVALSDPKPEDHWQGPTGFIHQVLFEQYLKNHPSPESCEYYLCGPPQMLDAVQKMLYDLGVEQENIYFDDFGAY